MVPYLLNSFRYVEIFVLDIFFPRQNVSRSALGARPLGPRPMGPRPLGLSLCPAVSGGLDILLGDRFRPKLICIPPLLTKKAVEFLRDFTPKLYAGSQLYVGDAAPPRASRNFEKSFGASTSFLHRLLIWLHARPTVISLAGGRQVFLRE